MDDLAALAAYICEAPISLISLVDEHRQWFKSKVGMLVSETPRDISFCGHAILEPGLFIVPDAAHDSRFADNPLVTGDPGIRFYAGAPLVTPDGHALGSLCVIDRVPRELRPSQREALRVLGGQVMAQLELRRQTRELQESEERLAQVFRSCPVALAVHRWSDRTFTDVNPAFTDLLGWERDDVIGRTTEELQIVDDAAVARIRSRLATSRTLRDAELTVRTRAGDVRDVLMGTEIIELHRELHAVTTFVDVTDRKRAELAAGRLAAIVESSDAAIVGKDLDGIVTSWNGGAERIFGYSALEMVGTSMTRLIPDDLHAEDRAILEQIRRGETLETLETRRLTRDGRLIDVSVTASPIKDSTGQIVGVSKVARDITETKRAERSCQASEARYRSLFESAPDGIVIADGESRYIDANASVCRMLGYTRDELVQLGASDIVVETEVAHIAPALDSIKSHSDYHREWKFRRKDGSVFDAEVMATMMPDGNLLGMIRDVTERKRHEGRFRRLVESNAQGVMFWDRATGVTGANDAFLRLAGYSREEMEAGALGWTALTSQDYVEADRRSVQEMATTGICTPFEREFIRRDGSRVTVLVGAAAFEDSPDQGVGFVLDLTERTKLEKQFLRAQRMEGIGTLAGGIAHDLNNELTPILLSIDALKERITDDEGQSILNSLSNSALRGAALVRQVLSFARGVEGRRIAVNVADDVRELEKVMRDTFPKTIDVQVEQARDLWVVIGDPTQMHQVLLNLCVNARDAMPEGGRLTVTTANVRLETADTAMNIDSRVGPYVNVDVADTGSGIPPEIRERIFEPFFTTKEVGKGTGLGLSTTLAIVKSHGGFINVSSDVGKGTRFRVYLPANVTARQAESTAGRVGMPRGHGELVLVVDDEESIRTVLKLTLERFGYRVVLAREGGEAAAIYARAWKDIAIVLSDMAMPVMDGASLFIALRAINPAVRIVASSGLATHDGLAKALGAHVHHFVPKPYTAQVLLTILQDALREPDA